MTTKQRKYAGRLWPLADSVAVAADATSSIDLSLSPSSGANGEKYRPVITGWHGAIGAAGTLQFQTEVSGTVMAGPFEYQAGAFEANYNPQGWARGEYGDGFVVSSSQAADLVITFAMEPEQN